MAKEFIKKGGARVGGANARTPGATLIVNEFELVLKVKFITTFKFPKNKIIRIKKVTFVPFLFWGIKIEHNIPIYDKNIYFWSWYPPKKLMEKISETGFIKN